MMHPHHNLIVTAPMIIKFGTVMRPDAFYTTVTKNVMTSLLLPIYDVITNILANTSAKILDTLNSQNSSLIWLKFRIWRYFWVL